VISHEVAARARNQRDQLLYQFVRREHDLRSAISPGLLEAKGKSAVGQFLQTVVRDRRPCQVSAEMFEGESADTSTSAEGSDYAPGPCKATQST